MAQCGKKMWKKFRLTVFWRPKSHTPCGEGIGWEVIVDGVELVEVEGEELAASQQEQHQLEVGQPAEPHLRGGVGVRKPAEPDLKHRPGRSWG